MSAQKALTAGVLAVASLLGIGAFLYPFFLPALAGTGSEMMAHASDAPLLTVVLMGLCLAAVFSSLGTRQMTSKTVALLGALTALAAAMRALPGPGGFNAIFLLPILAGYCYGPAFGFLLGALSLLVSAFIGGGVGPWLPYQMLAAGWVGLLSGLLPQFPQRRTLEAVLMACWGALLGLLFGAVMNLWFWPFLAGPAAVGTALPSSAVSAASSMLPARAAASWQPGMAVWAGVRNYLAFYTATSLWWDLGRAAGNAVLLMLLARPVLRVLRRFRARFQFEVV